MLTHEYIKTQIDKLPNSALDKVMDFIAYQLFVNNSFDDETDYVMSIPGMAEKLKEGMNTPLSECVPIEEVWADV
jgi:hypothetical protein